MCCKDSWYSTASELPLRVPSRIIPCVIDAPALKLEQEHDDADCVPVLSTERAVAKTARWVLQHERAVVVEDEARLPREVPDGYASSLSKMKVRDGPDAGGKLIAGRGVRAGGGEGEGWDSLIRLGEVGPELPHATEHTRKARVALRPTAVFIMLPRERHRLVSNAG